MALFNLFAWAICTSDAQAKTDQTTTYQFVERLPRHGNAREVRRHCRGARRADGHRARDRRISRSAKRGWPTDRPPAAGLIDPSVPSRSIFKEATVMRRRREVAFPFGKDGGAPGRVAAWTLSSARAWGSRALVGFGVPGISGVRMGLNHPSCPPQLKISIARFWRRASIVLSFG